jgi:hypothetical protein
MVTPLGDDMAKVCHRRGAERTLAPLDRQLVLAEVLEDGADVLQVSAPWAVVHETIIEEHKNEMSNEITQHLVHEGLECRWHIGEAEGHDEKLKIPMVCAERHLGNVVDISTWW